MKQTTQLLKRELRPKLGWRWLRRKPCTRCEAVGLGGFLPIGEYSCCTDTSMDWYYWEDPEGTPTTVWVWTDEDEG